MDLKYFPRFVAYSMVWTVVAVSVLSTVTVSVTDPSNSEVALLLLLIMIGAGLVIAVPLGLVTLLLGRPIMIAVYGLLSTKWPKLSVPLAGSSASLVPFGTLCLFTQGDLDLFASAFTSLVILLGLGALVGALTADRFLRATSQESP